MAIDLVTRREWGARPPRGAHTRISRTRGVKVHYTGDRVDPRLVDDHGRCVAAVRGIQRSHMDGNGWIDMGYSLLVCPHRRVFEGRGLNRLPAANGPGLNQGHYAVLGLVGTSGLVVPPPGMLHGIRDAIEYVRERGGAGREIKGHRDGYATSCPGDRLYAWVRAGAPRPEEDEVSPEEIYKAAWELDRMPVSYGSEENPQWKPRSVLVNHGEWLRRIDAKLDEQAAVRGAQQAVICELVAALGRGDASVDVDALVGRIEAAIERAVAVARSAG